jgi:3',5'-nucleoside bisphosphate phosphatase
MSALLEDLIDEGLQGIEVFYSEHSPEDRDLYMRLAARLNLIPTGGSDYHGSNKPGIHLGTGKGNNLNLPYSVLENLRR